MDSCFVLFGTHQHGVANLNNASVSASVNVEYVLRDAFAYREDYREGDFERTVCSNMAS